MTPALIAGGLWLLALLAAVVRRSWVWLGGAAVLGLVAALLYDGASGLITAVHEDSAATFGRLAVPLLAAAGVTMVAALLIAVRKRGRRG